MVFIAKELNNEGNFVISSVNIGKHLKNVSTHPSIKDGDLFVIRFADVMVGVMISTTIFAQKSNQRS